MNHPPFTEPETVEDQKAWDAWTVEGDSITVRDAGNDEYVIIKIGDEERTLNAGHVEQLVNALDRTISVAWMRGNEVLPHVMKHRRS